MHGVQLANARHHLPWTYLCLLCELGRDVFELPDRSLAQVHVTRGVIVVVVQYSPGPPRRVVAAGGGGRQFDMTIVARWGGLERNRTRAGFPGDLQGRKIIIAHRHCAHLFVRRQGDAVSESRSAAKAGTGCGLAAVPSPTQPDDHLAPKPKDRETHIHPLSLTHTQGR